MSDPRVLKVPASAKPLSMSSSLDLAHARIAQLTRICKEIVLELDPVRRVGLLSMLSLVVESHDGDGNVGDSDG